MEVTHIRIYCYSSLTQHPTLHAPHTELLPPGCTLHVHQHCIPPAWNIFKPFLCWMGPSGFPGPSCWHWTTLETPELRFESGIVLEIWTGRSSLAGEESRWSRKSNKKKNYQCRWFLLYFPLLLLTVHRVETERHHVDHHSSEWLYWPLWHSPSCLAFHCSHWVPQNTSHPARRGNKNMYSIFTSKTDR